MTSYVEYSSNNSGGHWWLTDKNWRALEAAGWKILWCIQSVQYDSKGDIIYEEDGSPKLEPADKDWTQPGPDGRWLGALATKAFKPGVTSLRKAVAEWQRITKQNPSAEGCRCCGNPHNFYLYVDGKMVDSGPEARGLSFSWET